MTQGNINYNNLVPLFSGKNSSGNYEDDRIKMFVHYLYIINPNNIYNGFNNNNPNETIGNFNEMMQVKNYFNKPNGSRDNDIHPEFYNFIINVAKFHRDLDQTRSNIKQNKLQNDLYLFLQDMNSFSLFTINVYKQILSLIEIDTNNSIPLEKIINLSNIGKYRFNIKKVTVRGNDVLITNNIIPRLGNWAGDVWKNNRINEQKNINTLYDLYLNIYNSDPMNTTVSDRESYQAPKKRTIFSINLDKYFRNLLNNQTETIDKEESSILKDTYSSIYSRNKDNRLLKNGELIDDKSEMFKQLAKINNNCMTTGFKDTDDKTCQDYINQCLTGVDIVGCNDFFEKEDFWDITQKEVNEMLPSVAIDTLSKFGFKKKNIYDETANIKLIKIESMNSWLKRLNKITTNKNVIRNIRNNIKLKGYINYLLTLINRNPAILNDNYHGESNESINFNINRFNYTNLYKNGLKPKYPTDNTILRDLDYTQKIIKSNNIDLELKGGFIKTTIDEVNNKNRYSSELIFDIIQDLEIKLGKNNIRIKLNDIYKMQEMNSELNKLEQKLYKIMAIIEKFSIIDNLFEKESKNIISIDEMNKITKKRQDLFSKKVKKEDKIFKLLNAISKNI
jgi:hypothetical protein